MAVTKQLWAVLLSHNGFFKWFGEEAVKVDGKRDL
jgi:hypothetical protein